MMTSSNGNIFRITGPLCGEFTGHRWISLTKSHLKGPWRQAFTFSLICARINGGVNNREPGDLRRHHAHDDVNDHTCWNELSSTQAKEFVEALEWYDLSEQLFQSDPQAECNQGKLHRNQTACHLELNKLDQVRSRPTPWWRHQMETFSALPALFAGNSPVTGEFPSQRPVTRSFDVFFDLRPNKRWSKQSWGWWFKTPPHSLWRHCNVHVTTWKKYPMDA